MFQMLSNGSLTLCHGFKMQGTLHRVQVERFHKVASDALAGSKTVQLEGNIKAGMNKLLNELEAGRFDDGATFKIRFVASELQLEPFPEAEILTSPHVISDLLS